MGWFSGVGAGENEDLVAGATQGVRNGLGGGGRARPDRRVFVVYEQIIHAAARARGWLVQWFSRYRFQRKPRSSEVALRCCAIFSWTNARFSIGGIGLSNLSVPFWNHAPIGEPKPFFGR